MFPPWRKKTRKVMHVSRSSSELHFCTVGRVSRIISRKTACLFLSIIRQHRQRAVTSVIKYYRYRSIAKQKQSPPMRSLPRDSLGNSQLVVCFPTRRSSSLSFSPSTQQNNKIAFSPAGIRVRYTHSLLSVAPSTVLS